MTIETGIDLNLCVPGQRVRFRDGKIGIYYGLMHDNELYTHSVDGSSYTKDGSFWYDNRESHLDVVEILPMEDKSAKTTKYHTVPELTHSIIDQIDVTSPDHVSIIPHEHGVTISIKKGLNTISWRHYNH